MVKQAPESRPKRCRIHWCFVLVMVLSVGCSTGTEETPTPAAGEYVWNLPVGFPTPKVPEDNPMSQAKVDLGRQLFYDTRLSGNGTQSCGTCHQQSLAFTDGLANAVGSTEQVHRRSAMGLTNVAYNSALTWANPLMRTLEEQALVPMFGESPVELGLSGQEDALLARLQADPAYVQAFAKAFPEEAEPISLNSIVRSLASFERTLISGNSPYDRYVYQGDNTALSDSAKHGMAMFFSEKLECYHCHGTFNFADSVMTQTSVFEEIFFHNTGLYNVDGEGAYPARDRGLIEMTGDDVDMGNFRAPTLRNIAVTAPYMHDGSVATLEDAIAHYAAAGRTLSSGPDAGVGSENPYKSELVVGFTLTEQEKTDLLAFLHALTDDTFLTDPRFSDPFAASARPAP